MVVAFRMGKERPTSDFLSGVRTMCVFEMLGVALFRFDPVPRVWVIPLIAVNATALAFVTTLYGHIARAPVVARVAVMVVIHARLDFVRPLGIGHVLGFRC